MRTGAFSVGKIFIFKNYKIEKESLQHRGFPGGHPTKY